MNERKTEENNIGAETTIVMSLRLLGGMDESDSETEEERKKEENWKKRVKANRREQAKNQYSYKKMEIYSRKTDEKMDKFLPL